MRATVLFILFFFSSTCVAGCAKEAQIAVSFMNQYLAYTQAVMNMRTEQTVIAWLGANRLVAPSFVSAYKTTEAEGLKEDPELGWGVDLILDAQDSPEKSFKLFQCSSAPGIVLLQGLDWPAFKVAVRVSPTAQGPKVIGAGMVNVPKNLRAQR